MAGKRLNIEVGDRLTKICIAKKHGKGVQASDNITFPTPANSVMDGDIVDPQGLAQALKAHLELNDIKNVEEMVVILDSAKFASREVLLPPVKKKMLDVVIEENVGSYFPVDLADYKVAYTVLEQVKGEEPGVRVQITIAPNALLTNCVRFAETCGIRLVAIDAMSNSQYQVLKGLVAAGATMAVNVGVSRTIVTFMKDGKLLLQRNIPVGGESLMREALAAQANAGIDFFKVLQRVESHRWMEENDVSIGNTDLGRFNASVARALDYFNSSIQAEELARIVVFGSCSGIIGLKESLAQELAKDTLFLSEMKGVEKLIDTDIPDLYATCLGTSIECLELLSPEMLRRIKVNNTNGSVLSSIRLGLFVLIAGTLGGGAMAGFAYLEYEDALAELTKTENRIEELSYVEEVYVASLEYDAMRKNIEVLETYGNENNNANLRAFMEELEDKMPSNLIALTADCTNESVSMSVEVETMDEAAVVISQLRTFESLDKIQVSTIEETYNDVGSAVVRFTIMCGYVTEETVIVPVEPTDMQWNSVYSTTN
ncbi:MAG: pilus assembly protein PilM [Lachnospiraceae bacterium]